MPAPPSLAPLAGLLADLAADLRRAECCLVVCDKGWTLPIYAALKERLRAMEVKCGYLDGRGTDGNAGEGGIMLATVAMMRYVVQAETEGVVYALPHLDVMTTTEGGWTPISREVIPLLYENPLTVWLGFQDPSLPLPDVVTKVFTRRYEVREKYRELKPAAPFEPPPLATLPPVAVANTEESRTIDAEEPHDEDHNPIFD